MCFTRNKKIKNKKCVNTFGLLSEEIIPCSKPDNIVWSTGGVNVRFSRGKKPSQQDYVAICSFHLRSNGSSPKKPIAVEEHFHASSRDKKKKHSCVTEMDGGWPGSRGDVPCGGAVQVLSKHFLFTCRTAVTTHHGPSWNAITRDSCWQQIFCEVCCDFLALTCRLNELAVMFLY